MTMAMKQGQRTQRMRRLSLCLLLLASPLVMPRHVAAGRGSRKIKLAEPTAKVKPEHDHITFDPLVAEVERHRDDEAWEKEYERMHHEHHHVHAGHHHEHEDMYDGTIDELHDEDAEHEEFLHDAGVDNPDDFTEDGLDHVSMEKRIDELFPLIDIFPADGRVDLNELAAWELMQYQQMQSHRMDRELESLDRDGNGLVSLKEFMQEEDDNAEVKHWSAYPEHDQEYYKQEMQRFAVADDDHDGQLNHDQLYKAMHPEESDDPQMMDYMRKEELRNYDVNKNGKIELEEWMEGFWHIIHDWEAEEMKWDAKHHQRPYKEGSDPSEKRAAGQKRFKDLDTDGDGALSSDELEPIMHMMVPGEKHFAVQTARHLMEQADDDGDTRLSMHEMKKHKHVFYELEQTRDNHLSMEE